MKGDILRWAMESAKRLECVRLAGALARAKKREQARRAPNTGALIYADNVRPPGHGRRTGNVLPLLGGEGRGDGKGTLNTAALVRRVAEVQQAGLSLRNSSEHSDWFPSPFPSPLPSPQGEGTRIPSLNKSTHIVWLNLWASPHDPERGQPCPRVGPWKLDVERWTLDVHPRNFQRATFNVTPAVSAFFVVNRTRLT